MWVESLLYTDVYCITVLTAKENISSHLGRPNRALCSTVSCVVTFEHAGYTASEAVRDW